MEYSTSRTTENQTPMALDADQHKLWLNAILTNDCNLVERTLSTLYGYQKLIYLHGHFTFPPCRLKVANCLCDYDKDNNYTFPHAFHMAVAFDSRDVVLSFLKHGVDATLTNENNFNVVHLLAYLGFMKENYTEKAVAMYRLIRNNVSLATMDQLLLQENNDRMRPLEYAIHLSVSNLAAEILNTTPTHIIHESWDDSGVTTLVDVHDYEKHKGRLVLNPLTLLALFERRNISGKNFTKFFYSDVMETWIRLKIRAMKPFLLLYLVIRILFMFLVYEADTLLSVLEDMRIKTETGVNETCVERSEYMHHLSENVVFAIVLLTWIYSLFGLFLGGFEMCFVFCGSEKIAWSRNTPNKKKTTIAHFRFYKTNQLFLYSLVCVNFLVRFMRLQNIVTIPFTFDHLCFVLFSSCLVWSIMQFVQLLPKVGYFVVALQRMLANLVCFLLVFFLFTGIVSLLFYRVVNFGQTTCVAEMKNQESSLYSVFLVLLNMLDFRLLHLQNDSPALVLHMVFVFVGNVMLLNFLIGVFSSNVAWVQRHRDILLTVQRICVVVALDRRLSRFFGAPYRRLQSRVFIQHKGKYCIKIQRQVHFHQD